MKGARKGFGDNHSRVAKHFVFSEKLAKIFHSLPQNVSLPIYARNTKPPLIKPMAFRSHIGIQKNNKISGFDGLFSVVLKVCADASLGPFPYI